MVKSGLVAPRTQTYLVEKQHLHFFKSLCSAHQGLAGFNNSHELCRMFFKTQTRVNPQTGELSTYYRLVESYRNVLGEVRQRSILPAGFMDDITPEELWAVADGLNARYSGDQNLFAHTEKVQRYIDLYWDRLVSEKKLDIVREVRGKEAKKDWQKIDMGSIKNKDVREAGAEWLSVHAASQLRLEEFFKSAGFTEEEGNLALSHIVSRAVYPASELKTVSFMQENSSICELTGVDASKVTKDRLYEISKKLYSVKDKLECHLSRKTNELFDLEDKILLFDLTNTYFEGEKRSSRMAKRGRSKEKRDDCLLLVLALVVNVEGFIKYSHIYEGNRADCTTLCEMIDNLRLATSYCEKKPIVVIDAGISTEENLAAIVSKGYDYVCVSRSGLNKYKCVESGKPVCVTDNRNRLIELVEVQTEKAKNIEYYLKVSSEGKRLKETSMHNQFHERFEEGLQIIANAIGTKHGTKRYDKVNQRIGRLKAKYPSVNRLYEIHLEKDENDVCQLMSWTLIPDRQAEIRENLGSYLIRTSMEERGELTVWRIYNCIREIESGFRCLKSDLDMRPIFHKSDEASEAHIHLAVLAYWIVNTIRFQLKKEGIHSDWREIVRIMNTQKCVTTTMVNDKGTTLWVRQCSEPNEKVKMIYAALKMKPAPFTRKKSVVLKTEPKKMPVAGFEVDTG